MRWPESVTLGRTLIAAVAVTAVMVVALVVVAHRTRGRAHRARTVLAVLTSVCAVMTAVLVASVPVAMSHGMQSFGTPLAQYPVSVARSHVDESSQLRSVSDIRGKVVILYRFGCPDCEAAYDGIEEKVSRLSGGSVVWVSSRSAIGQDICSVYDVDWVPSVVSVSDDGDVVSEEIAYSDLSGLDKAIKNIES